MYLYDRAKAEAELEPNCEIMGTLWNGGWDDYVVDTTDTIPEDKTKNYPEITTGSPNHRYIQARFSGKFRDRFPGLALRMVKHLQGGD
jgi:hypothetical protein